MEIDTQGACMAFLQSCRMWWELTHRALSIYAVKGVYRTNLCIIAIPLIRQNSSSGYGDVLYNQFRLWQHTYPVKIELIEHC